VLEWIDLAPSYEHDNGSSVSIRGRGFLDWLSDYWFLKKDSAPGSQLFFIKIPFYNSSFCF
jgi:hypothetical protein